MAWEHTVGKGRVFGTTLGHDMKTTADPHYLQLLANGLLWSCDKLDDDGNRKPGFAGRGPKPERRRRRSRRHGAAAGLADSTRAPRSGRL